MDLGQYLTGTARIVAPANPPLQGGADVVEFNPTGAGQPIGTDRLVALVQGSATTG